MISHSFNSSSVSLIDYHPDTKVLIVTFKNGGIYEYSDVPQDVIDKFLVCESAGRFLQTHIKNKFTAIRRDSNWFVESWSSLYNWIRVSGFPRKDLAEQYIREQGEAGVEYRIKQYKLNAW